MFTHSTVPLKGASVFVAVLSSVHIDLVRAHQKPSASRESHMQLLLNSDDCKVRFGNGTCVPQFNGTSDVMNMNHYYRQYYNRTTYETYLLDAGDSDYSIELDFLVFELCDGHDFLTVYDGRDKHSPVLAHKSGAMDNLIVRSSQRYMYIEFNATRRQKEHVSRFEFDESRDLGHLDSAVLAAIREDVLDFHGWRAKVWKKCNKPGFHTQRETCVKSKTCVCENGIARQGIFCRAEGMHTCLRCHHGYILGRDRKCILIGDALDEVVAGPKSIEFVAESIAARNIQL